MTVARTRMNPSGKNLPCGEEGLMFAVEAQLDCAFWRFSAGVVKRAHTSRFDKLRTQSLPRGVRPYNWIMGECQN